MLASVVVAGSLVTIPVLGTHAWRLLKTSTEGRCAVRNVALTYIQATPSAVLALTDPNHKVTSIELLALKPAVKGVYSGGTVVIVPATTTVVLPDGTSGPVNSLFTSGGADALKNGVDGVLGITSSMIVVEDAAALGAQLTPVGQISVSLTAPVTQQGANGADTQLFPAGAATVAPAQVGTLLAAQGSTDTEAIRLERERAVWLAVAARVGAGVSGSAASGPAAVPSVQSVQSVQSGTSTATTVAATAPTTGTPTCGVTQNVVIPAPKDFPTFFSSLLAASVNVYQLAGLQRNVTPTTPAGTVSVDVTEVAWLMARLVPASVSPANDGPTVYVKSAFSDLVTQTAIARLLFSGANVVLVTVPTGTPPATSTVSVSDQSYLAAAKMLGATLGQAPTVAPTSLAIDGVNVIITLGEDFNAAVTANATANTPATTTTTTITPTTPTAAATTVEVTTTAAPATTKAKKKP